MAASTRTRMSSEPSKRTNAPRCPSRPASSGQCMNIVNGPWTAPRLFTIDSKTAWSLAATWSLLVIGVSLAIRCLLFRDEDFLDPAAALAGLHAHEAVLLLAHEDQLFAAGQRGDRGRLVGRLGEEPDVGDLRPQHVAFVEDRAGLRHGARFLVERADAALEARVAPHRAHDAVVVVGEARRDDLALGRPLVAAESRHRDARAAEQSAQPEVRLLGAALGRRDLKARAGVGQEHARLGFLELEPAGHRAEDAPGRAEHAADAGAH